MFTRFPAFLVCASLVLCACSSKHYRESADKEVAAAIAQKTPAVPNMDTNFTIETVEKAHLANLPVASGTNDFFGPEGEKEKDARIISLEKALEIATKQSRDYQFQKELLYLEGLE